MTNVNLIPTSVLRAQTCREHLRHWGIAITVALMALAASYSVEWSRRLQATKLSSRAVLLAENVNLMRTQLKSAQIKSSQVHQQIERARALRAKRSWSGMFALINTSMPEGCWLTSIATDPATPAAQTKAVIVTAVKKPEDPQHQAVTIETPQKLRIAGYATEPTEPLGFVLALQERGVFSEVQLVTSASEPILDGTYFKFEIVCEWQS